jgi:hypothetical protein
MTIPPLPQPAVWLKFTKVDDPLDHYSPQQMRDFYAEGYRAGAEATRNEGWARASEMESRYDRLTLDLKRIDDERSALRALLRRWVEAADETGGEVWCGDLDNEKLYDETREATGMGPNPNKLP